MFDISKYDFLIFDCDGVILDSNKLKSNAFAEALSNEPSDFILKFVEYHKKNGGKSRYEKFRYYFENMKNQIESEEEIEIALNKFASIVSKGLLKCNYIPGVIEFIKRIKILNDEIYVVSGSDEEELINVFKERGIINYFKEVYGSPIGKFENTKKVINTTRLNQKGVFIGDSKMDYLAAKQFGLDFVFVEHSSEWESNSREKINDFTYSISDFFSLLPIRSSVID